MVTPVHKNEQTGQAGLDRIQQNVRALIADVRSMLLRLAAAERHSLMLTDAFTTTIATATSTKLTFPVRAEEIWDIDYYGAAGCAGDALGMKYAIAAPTGSTIAGYLDSNLANSTDDTHVAISAVNTLTSAVHTVNGGTRPDHINVRIKVGHVDGSITLQAACTTAGRTTTIDAGAYLRAHRVTSV